MGLKTRMSHPSLPPDTRMLSYVRKILKYNNIVGPPKLKPTRPKLKQARYVQYVAETPAGTKMLVTFQVVSIKTAAWGTTHL